MGQAAVRDRATEVVTHIGGIYSWHEYLMPIASHTIIQAYQPPSMDEEQKGAYMSCLICAGQAESVECAHGWEERCCSRCGCYRMSQALILVMMEEGQIFDTERMREWLVAQRGQVSVPAIDHAQAILFP